MREKPIIHAILVCILAVLVFTLPAAGLTAYASAADETIVKVGYFYLADYYRTVDGAVDSYDSAYLAKIEEYSNICFEYVDCGTWSDALTMLRNHEIDLVGTMQRSNEREKEYDFSDEAYGTTAAELLSLPDSDITFQDYEAISAATIGVTENYVRMDQLEELLKEKNLSSAVRYYANQNALCQALENGEVDIVAANSHGVPSDWKVVERFCFTPYFFATWNGNETLIHELDEAIEKIRMYDNGFEQAMLQHYFPTLIQEPFSKEELDFIAEHNTYTVYFDSATAPLVWYDEATDEMQGMLIDVCKLLSEHIGVALHFRPADELVSVTDEYAITYGNVLYERGSHAIKLDNSSDSIFDTTYQAYHWIGDEYDEESAYTIAITKNRENLPECAQKIYPNANVVEFDTPSDCLNALVDKKVDLAIVNEYIADTYMVQNNIKNIVGIKGVELAFGVPLKFTGEHAALLRSIFNKAIGALESDQINNIVRSYSLDAVPKTTLAYFVQSKPFAAMGIVLGVVLLCVLCAVALTYANVMKRERSKVEQANAAKSEFLSRMSHDMRTPMNGILGLVTLMMHQDLSQETKEDLQQLQMSGQYLLNLINDTLDVNKIEADKIELHPVVSDAFKVTENISTNAHIIAANKNVSLVMEKINPQQITHTILYMDEARVEQIFMNIVSNAVKFTPAGGSVHLTIERLETTDDYIVNRYQVIDTGIGMSEEFQKHIFEPFAQEGRIATNRESGTGLGMAIVHRLVELMGGTVEVKSKINEGTTFTVVLKFECYKGEVANASETSVSDVHLDGKRILLCEDHPLNRQIAVKLLEKKGILVQTAENGADGVHLFQESPENHYDLILMDIRMPVMDGLTATQAIRAMNRRDAQTIPIIAMTANAFDNDIKKCLSVGMNAHIAKPLDVEKMYSVIAAHMLRTPAEK